MVEKYNDALRDEPIVEMRSVWGRLELGAAAKKDFESERIFSANIGPREMDLCNQCAFEGSTTSKKKAVGMRANQITLPTRQMGQYNLDKKREATWCVWAKTKRQRQDLNLCSLRYVISEI